MIVTVMEAGSGPGDYARVRLVSEYDGVNPVDVIELSVGLRPSPMGQQKREYEVGLRAGDSTEYDDDAGESPPTLFHKRVDLTRGSETIT